MRHSKNTSSKTDTPMPSVETTESILKKIVPTGTWLQDGLLRLEFVLPIACDAVAPEIARSYVEKLGMKKVKVLDATPAGENFCFVQVEAVTHHKLDATKVKVRTPELPSAVEILKRFREGQSGKLSILALSIGQNRYHAGLEPLLSLQGMRGESGIEGYPIFKIRRAELPTFDPEAILEKITLQDDVLFLSWQQEFKDGDLRLLKDFLKRLKKEERAASGLLKFLFVDGAGTTALLKVGFEGVFDFTVDPRRVAHAVVEALFQASPQKDAIKSSTKEPSAETV